MEHCPEGSNGHRLRLCEVHPGLNLEYVSDRANLHAYCTHLLYEGARVLYEMKGAAGAPADGFQLVLRQRKTHSKALRAKRGHPWVDGKVKNLFEKKAEEQQVWLSINLHYTEKAALNALIDEMIESGETGAATAEQRSFFESAMKVVRKAAKSNYFYEGIVVQRWGNFFEF